MNKKRSNPNIKCLVATWLTLRCTPVLIIIFALVDIIKPLNQLLSPSLDVFYVAGTIFFLSYTFGNSFWKGTHNNLYDKLDSLLDMEDKSEN
ncbi:hypothetical protein [Halobacteriovorax sp. CON-3]|uniref:hypothetical protein n=1 Tax=Halobacteriovorax sp. CON-3 TaxID=3157710 RepID=UPI00371E0814